MVFWDARGAHNCPRRWVKCKEARSGCKEDASLCPGCVADNISVDFVLQRPQANELRAHAVSKEKNIAAVKH